MAAKKRSKKTKKRAAPAKSRAARAPKPPPPPKRGRGRPPEFVESQWVEPLLDYLCGGGSVFDFGGKEGHPSVRTLYRWMDRNKAFAAQVQRAYEVRADYLAEQSLQIADFTANDTEVRTNRAGDEYEVPNHEWIARSRLRVDQRMRMAACLNRRWSTKHQVEHTAGETFDEMLSKALGLTKKDDSDG